MIHSYRYICIHTLLYANISLLCHFKYVLGASLCWFPWDTMVNIYSLSPGSEEAEANILDAEVLEDPQLSVTMYWVI